MNIYTIGFTQKNAETFFNLIKAAGILTVVDVRLNNVSQLSGFAKKEDLAFFLKELCGVKYIHAVELAPTAEMLNAYKKENISWQVYQEKFMSLMAQRNIERYITSDLLNESCLLCSEHEPHFCHRRLVVEYLQQYSRISLSVKHLL